MLTDAPLAVGLLFIATVAGMLVLVLWGAARAARRVGPGAVRGVRVAGVAVVAAQAFRIPVEIVLWQLAVAGALPELLTFHGRNVDILVGLTAPVVAYACFVRRAWPARVARWWNWAGIVILLNVVVHAQLSAPTPWRIFETDPPTTVIADWPYIWLPAFLVPLAWLLHAVSLRQLRSR